ncbi:MAG: hypothetical protein ACJ75P_03575 [Gaiellaceae bacterium]
MSAAAFDFWLGRWEVRWGEGARGTNEITKVLDGRVVLERFDGRPGTELLGMSVSVYDSDDGLWRQTWVDSQGSYLQFHGNAHDGVMKLRGEHGAEPRRMVWRDIEDASLTWLWERSGDGGSRWETLWELAYSRVE